LSTLAQRLQDLALRISTEVKALRTLINGNAADLSALTTTAKTNLVAALNEVKAAADAAAASGGAAIDDAATNSTEAWSSQKVSDYVAAQLATILGGAPAALDTLKELADAIGDDASFATTITTALGNRVRTDTAAQGLNATQKQNARTNIDAYGSVEIGNPDTDFVATFNAGLV
jgi:hypothetical protein